MNSHPSRFPRKKTILLGFSAITFLSAFLTPKSEADIISWDGEGGDGLWGNAANWFNTTTSTNNLAPAGTDSLVFGIGGPGIVDLGGNRTDNSLSFTQNGFTLGVASTTNTLTNTSGLINVSSGITAQINAILANTSNGLTLSGGGNLTLSGANTFVGTVNVNASTLSIGADNNLGAAANGVTLAAGTLSTGGTFTSSRALTLGAGGGTVDVTGAGALSLSTALVANANALTKTGSGALNLSAASTRTGTTAINGGKLAITNISALGTGAVTVSGAASVYEINTAAATSAHTVNVDNGGTFQWTQNAQLTVGGVQPINFTGTGGTIFVGGSGSTGKVLAGTGLLSSAATSTLTKTGGGVLQISGANTGFLGNVSIQAGTIEFQNIDSFGTAAKTVTIGGTGDLATGAVNNRNNIVLNVGGTISANSASANYTGSVTVNGTSNVALRAFQTTTAANSFAISGPISGTGTLNVAAPAAATLTLSGNNAGYSGTLSAGLNSTIQINSNQSLGTGPLALAGGTISYRGSNSALASLGTPGLDASYYNFGSNPGTGSTLFATSLLQGAPFVSTRTDATINLPNPGANGVYAVTPVPGFGVTAAGGTLDGAMWKGLLTINMAGSYQFSGTNDDNAVLFIDGQQVGTLGVVSTSTNVGTPVTLSAGQHSIVYKFTQGGGGGYTTLSYNGGAGSDTAGNTVLVGSIANTLTNGSLAATPLGTVNATVTGGTLDVSSNTNLTTLNISNGVTANFSSPTNSTLSIIGSTTLNGGTAGLNSVSALLSIDSPIGETTPSALTLGGGYVTRFNVQNTYTGLTTVTGGQLELNATGANSIPANLTVNAANPNGAISNVELIQADQISDTATLTVTNGVFNLGAINETVGTLVLNGATGGLTNGDPVITGTTGVINAGTLDVRVGRVDALLGGTTGLTKNTPGALILTRSNPYTGTTNITQGTLIARGVDALGTGAAGTVVSGTGNLQLQGASLANEDITISGAGLNSIGASNIKSLTTGAAATAYIPDGELIINGGLSVAGGALTKAGNGTLTFATNQATIPSVTLSGGSLGFSGPQSFGAATVPAGRAYQFNSDPGAGVSLTAGAGSTIIANYGAADTLLSRITPGSAGTLALATDSSAALNFTGSSLKLGAKGMVDYSGTITPNAGSYQFGGTSVSGTGQNILNLYSTLTGANAVSVSGGILNLNTSANSSSAPGLFTGGISVTGGGTIRALNDPNLGSASGVVTLDNGTLQYTTTNVSSVATQFGLMGSGINNVGRTINIGAGGGTLDISARSYGGAAMAITQANSITGGASTTLTKSGFGQLLVVAPMDGTSTGFKGNLVLAANSGQVNVIGGPGYIRGLASVTVNQSAVFQADNSTGLGQVRQFVYGTAVNGTETDKIGDTIPITLNGGTLNFQGRAVALGLTLGGFERVGTVNAGFGQSTIATVSTGGGGAEFAINNLVRSYGSGTLRLNGTNLGLAGANSRIVPVQINGASPATNSFVGGWLTVNGTDFGTFLTQASTGTIGGIGNYGAAGFSAYTALSTATAPGAGGWTSGTVGNAAANVVLGTAGAGQNFSVGAVRMNLAGAQTLTFAGTTGTPDTLYLESGGLLSDGAAQPRTIGATTNAFTRGRLTAGATSATTPQELFLHNNANTFTINSQIIDNPNNAAATVRVVKDLDGTFVLDGSNTYSGGTTVLRGTLTANSTGSLGTGGVAVKNSVLNLGTFGASTGAVGVAANSAVYTTADQAQIVLTNTNATAAGIYNGAGDRFNISAGSQIYGNSPGAGAGLNSLTRIATPTSFTAGGQVYLAPDSIVVHNVTNGADQGTGALTIQNLGTNADLYYSPAGTAIGAQSSITVGAGTPWKGLSSDRSARSWNLGTINANSDFYLQSLTRDGGFGSLSLGADGGGSFAINNNSNAPINAFVSGNVILQDDAPVRMPGDLTFVLTPGSIFQPNRTSSLGNPTLVGGGIAKVVVQNGATLDPGSFAAAGSAANQDTATRQNLVYPIASPLNGSVTVEAGGQFLINDVSGIGSAPVGSYVLKTDSILHLGNSNAFFGRGNQPFDNIVDTTGYINPGQFVLEPGVVVRADADILGLSQFINGATNGETAVIEIYNGSRTLTNQNNPFIRPVVGTPTIQAENIRLANGGMLTNDDADRQLNNGRGRLILGDGAVLAGTTSTYINIQEGFEVEPNATINIGSNRWVDGMPKLGGVQLLGPNSNTIPASATVNIANGAQLMFSNVNVWPDTIPINLSTAVSAFPAPGAPPLLPGTGTSLALNTANFTEIMGPLTGNGAVISNQASAALGVGYGATSDFTFNGVFKQNNGIGASLTKVGATKMTLTGVSDSAAEALISQGELSLAGNGQTAFNMRIAKGALLTLDNSGTALNNRLGGKSIAPTGGSLNLIGNATTPVTETLANLYNSSTNNISGVIGNPGYSYATVSAGAATTTLVLTNIEDFQAAGIGQQRSGTWVLRSPTLGNAPATYNSAATLAINGANLTNGLIQVTNPKFVNGTSGATFGVGAGGNILGAVGTPLVATRPDVLGDVSLTGQGTGFVTEDIVAGGMRLLAASEYGSTVRDNMATAINLKSTGTLNTSGDTRIQSITMTPGSTINISGTRALDSTPSRLHIAGGVFVQSGGTSTINGGTNNFLQVNGGASLFLHTQGNLNLNAKVFTDQTVVKTNAGTLNVGSDVFTAFRGSLQIDDGIVNLATNNSFYVSRAQTGFNANNNLYLNGGTLNLGGNSQVLAILSNNNPLPGQGGTLTSATPATVSIASNSQFSGTISGSISLDKIGPNGTAGTTLLLTNDNTYTGSTLIRQGTVSLRDSGKLSGTSGVEVAYSTLQLDNGYLSNVTNRIPATTPVTLRGGTINLTGAAGQVASQTFNTLTLAAGTNNLTGNAGGSGATEINIGNLDRPAGTGSFLTFGQNYGFLGTAGNNTTAVRNFITNVNGTPLALNDGIIGGWAIATPGNGTAHFATYLPSTGVGAMSNTADGYANYSSTDISLAGAADNVNDGATARTLAASKTINSLRTTGSAAIFTVNNGVALTIDSGGWIHDVGSTGSLTAASNASGMSITSNSGELDHYVQQNTTGINIPIIGNIDLVKSGPGGLNLRPEGSFTATATGSGLSVLNTSVTTGLAVGMPISGTGIAAGTTISSITPGVSIGLSLPTTAAVAAIAPVFGNSYTGKTIVNGGTLTLNLSSPGLPGYRAIPGDLVINNATVTENAFPGQMNPNVNITITGTGRFNAASATGVTDTIGSITAFDIAGTSVAQANILDRTLSAPTSTVNFTAATAITTTNTNPTSYPFIGGNAGVIGFTNPTGSTLNITSPVTSNGLGAVGLRIDAMIGSVPTVAEGGLIKDGTGLLVLSPNNGGANINFTGVTTGYNGNVSSLVDVLNVKNGYVRFDAAGALGTNTANTTVQSGAVLLGSNAGSVVATGSIKLKDGATLASTINSFTLGAATTTVANQSVLNIPSGNVNIAAYDYFVQGTNSINSTINGRLTGSGNINITGPQLTIGGGGGGVITLGNPLLSGSGPGQSDYNGTITVGVNSVLQNLVPLVGSNTRNTGNALGAATVKLDGGRLRIRDDASATADVSSASVTYGNNVILSADSFLDVNRNTSTTAVNNMITLGTLSVPSGNKTLTVDSTNGYTAAFTQLNGPGMLVKSGLGNLNINSLGAGANLPSFGIAGPTGRSVNSTFNSVAAPNQVVNFVSAVNSFKDFAVNGSYITPAKTFNASGTFSVNPNADNISGMLAVANTTTINAATFLNNGQVGATGGAAIITASSGFQGSGHYVTNSQPLTLAGSVTGGSPRFAGNSTTTLTGTANSFTAAEVQSGTLLVKPSGTATSSGTLSVIGSPASTVSGSSAPIAAVSASLKFDNTAGSMIHTGNISNSGLVQVSNGATTINGTISGSAVTYTPGLLEGMIQNGLTTNPYDASAARLANPGNFGIRMEPRMAQSNIVTGNALTGWTDGQMWVYTGYIKDTDGIFSFAENIDDSVGIWVDGTKVLDNSTYNIVTTTGYTSGLLGTAVSAGANTGTATQNFGAGTTLPGYGSGWHLIELRFANGAGGAGPVPGNGFTNTYGLGYKDGIGAFDGADYIKPIDNGTGNLFVTPVGGKGTIQVDSTSTLTAGGTTLTAAINLNGGTTAPTAANFKLTGAAFNSDADAVNVVGANARGNVNLGTGHVLTTPNITVATGGNMTINPAAQGGTGEFKLAGPGALASANGTGTFNVEGGTFHITTGSVLNNTASVLVSGGDFKVNGAATASDLFVSGTGSLSGNGIVNSNITQTGGFISPGNSPGMLTTNGNIVSTGGAFVFDLNGPAPTTNYDQLTLNGQLTLNSVTVATFNVGYTPNPMTDWFFLIKSSSPILGEFAGLPEGASVDLAGQTYTATYHGDSSTGASFGGNDFALVPEPGAVMMTVSAGFLCFFRRRRNQA